MEINSSWEKEKPDKRSTCGRKGRQTRREIGRRERKRKISKNIRGLKGLTKTRQNKQTEDLTD